MSVINIYIYLFILKRVIYKRLLKFALKLNNRRTQLICLLLNLKIRSIHCNIKAKNTNNGFVCKQIF